MSEPQEKSTGQVARDELVSQVVGTLAYVAVVAAIGWAIGHRYMIEQVWRRAQARRKDKGRDPHARVMAEFRREVSDISRGTAGPDLTRAPGLYERP